MNVREVFSRAGIRCTRQRQRVYLALANSKSHPTPEDLYNTVRESDESLSLATVYNCLDVFTRHGLCRRMQCAAGSGAARYDADTSDHVHITISDGRVLDVPDALSKRLLATMGPELMGEIGRQMGVNIEGISLELHARAD